MNQEDFHFHAPLRSFSHWWWSSCRRASRPPSWLWRQPPRALACSLGGLSESDARSSSSRGESSCWSCGGAHPAHGLKRKQKKSGVSHRTRRENVNKISGDLSTPSSKHLPTYICLLTSCELQKHLPLTYASSPLANFRNIYLYTDASSPIANFRNTYLHTYVSSPLVNFRNTYLHTYASSPSETPTYIHMPPHLLRTSETPTSIHTLPHLLWTSNTKESYFYSYQKAALQSGQGRHTEKEIIFPLNMCKLIKAKRTRCHQDWKWTGCRQPSLPVSSSSLPGNLPAM